MTSATFIHKLSVMGIHFVPRPIDETAPEGALGMVDNGVGGGWTDRQMAMVKNGQWVTPKGKPLRFVPNYWTVLDDEAHRSAP